MWMACRAALTLLVLTSAACWGEGSTGADAGPTIDVTVVEPDVFRDCRGRPFTPLPSEDWRHLTTEAIVITGDANHSAQDVISPPTVARSLPGKFTYGLASKDLEDEKIHVWLDDCAGWRDLGEQLTDSDGRMSVAAPTELGPGVYESRFQVIGDQSTTTSYLWVLPVGTHVVVTDVDATLTESDSELFYQILDGSHVPTPYPGAVDLTLAHVSIGHVVVYLTGRPYWLTQQTRDWLSDQGCGAGPLHVTDSNTDILPTDDSVGAYKQAWLEGLIAAGYLVDLAYGNALTDIHAYMGAGMAADRLWIIGPEGGTDGTNAVGDTWETRVTEVRALPEVVQPFSW
jgi:hypothetical protein